MCLEVFLTSIQSNKIVSKIISIFFLKALQKYYQILIHGYFIHVWPLPSKTIMPTCRNFDVIYMQKMNSIPVLFFSDIAKISQTCYTEYFQNAWSSPSIMIVSPCRKLWCLSACKKSTSSLTYLLRYCKDITNLLLWELWECLTILIKNHSINL